MNEFDFIRTHLAPLSVDACGLQDDAALLTPPEGMSLVVTKDVICEGTHFIGNEAPELIAKKLLRVNLSDLAAKGATPWRYFLGLSIGDHQDHDWLTRFASGLAEDQKEYGIQLSGGDTTRVQGNAVLSLTALGLVPNHHMLLRSGAIVGDTVYMTGTLGDAALGLIAAKQNLSGQGYLIDRYRLPLPRVTLGTKLLNLASACLDISDGLVQDAGHLCAASNIGMTLRTDQLPLSDAAQAWLTNEQIELETLLTGGDDYELLFTAPAKANIPHTIDGVAITAIGTVTVGNNVHILDEHGNPLTFNRPGWTHF